MINGTHAVIYTTEPEECRAFFRDKLGMNSVDAGRGWRIFALPPAELGIHPSEAAENGRHSLFLMCDDVEKTMAELSAKGVEFTQPVKRERYGLLTAMRIPGGSELWMYQPTHPSPIA